MPWVRLSELETLRRAVADAEARAKMEYEMRQILVSELQGARKDYRELVDATFKKAEALPPHTTSPPAEDPKPVQTRPKPWDEVQRDFEQWEREKRVNAGIIKGKPNGDPDEADG